MGKKSASQIRRLQKRAEARGDTYEVIIPSEEVEDPQETKEEEEETVDPVKERAARALVEALKSLETNKDNMNAKDRRSARRKAEAIASEQAGCETSELLEWYEKRKMIETQKIEDEKAESPPMLTEEEKKKLQVVKIYLEEIGKIEKDESLNSKDRRSAKRKAEAIASSNDSGTPIKELLEWYENNKQKLIPKSSSNKRKRNDKTEDKISTEKRQKEGNPYILFVGQLSFDTTADGLFEHFQKELGKNVITQKSLSIRLLTDKNRNNKSRGMAFAELKDPEVLYECLKLHHTFLDGRRINIERSAGGSKNSDLRKEKLTKYRKEQEEYMSETVDKILTEYYQKGDIMEGELDEGVIALMKRRSAAVVEAALSEYVEERVKEMDNPSAYLTSMVCRITEEGIENKKLENKKQKHNASGTKHSKNNKHFDGSKRRTSRNDSKHDNSYQSTSELSKFGVDMSISSTAQANDMNKIFPSMSRGRGRGRGGYM